MSEQENRNNEVFDEKEIIVGDGDFDLGSTSTEDFDPFGDSELENAIEEDKKANEKQPQTTSEKSVENKKPPKEESSVNPLEAAINDAENQEIEKAQQSLFEKLPVFEYAGASENVEDASKTFEDLRIEKATDFPELDDGKRVSWSVEYGKITKSVSDPKGTTIGKLKTDIETSKEFLESLKKSKDKNPACKLKPRVTAQSKGQMAAYKGIYPTFEDAEESGKIITIIPAKDGIVYEMRKTDMGRFITPINGCEMLSEVRSGFTPALPRVPSDMLLSIISFFRYFMNQGSEREALVNLYWDKQEQEYVINPPEQTVSKASVESRLSDDFPESRYIHYMDIHSHNSMKAFFSSIDDKDEKATRLYAVIGRMDKLFPDICVRISNGGKYLKIEPRQVFQEVTTNFPLHWVESVNFRHSHAIEDEDDYKDSIFNSMKSLQLGGGDLCDLL